MTIVSISYSYTPSFNNPSDWLKRIAFATGTLERLALKHEVHSIEQINYIGVYEKENVKYHFIRFNEPRLFPLKLNAYVKKLKPDMVLVHGLIFPLQLNLLGRLLGSHTKIMVLHHAEKPLVGYKKYFQQWADHYVHRYFFAGKEMGEEWIKNKIIRDRTKVIEMMQSSSRFNSSAYLNCKATSEADPVYLWVGRLDVNKDPLTVIRAFLRLLKIAPRAKLFMIYQEDTLLPAINNLFEQFPSGKSNICMVGKLEHEELGKWYNLADYIISSSHYEGSGIAVCEAMSCGCIPIVTNIPSFKMMTGRGKCGRLFTPGNEEELYNNLAASLHDNRGYESQLVLEQFNKELSFEAIANTIEREFRVLNQVNHE